MKRKKRLPIFLELTIGSLAIIVAILVIYTGIQIVSINFFSIDYQKEQVRNRYEEIKYLLSNINIEGKEIDEFIGNEDEFIRIYKDGYVEYATDSNIWDKIELSDESVNLRTKVKYIRFEKYIVLDEVISIKGEEHKIQIVKGENIFHEFIESYFETFIFALFIGLVLSVIGAIYLSKRFILRLKVLSNTMTEIKKNGITQRVEISESNDEFDKVNIVFNSMMDDLQESFDNQSRFVSDASHELRTPLTALLGHLKMIKRWGKNDKERLEKSLDICIDETERLSKIVSDLLIISRNEKEVINLDEIEPINVEPVILYIVENYKILNNNVKFEIIIDSNLKVKIMKDHLKQILIIFIDNAIKYNNKGNIEINIKLTKVNNKIIISVKDNGMGIPKAEIPYVLNRLYKVDKSRCNTNKSFGLGLSIADRIVNNYKGKIIILSELGEFTEIIVEM
ncbi:HAMP domain-containing histidine kinase [Clostridium gasigenes]|uniref:sensor histidine kinase n=1 Tax=Clostridium gasigenes TaxID=94869 RepID=UPI001625A754|nr:HAMP domain-containing sensor histidine kinase [Clostridium gasigenes]MBB6625460.1 HAMP domain-containing histidine kinase [Clostridium gasigenes]MBU3088774.1 HAMP domain-containing histidine kinase [Clostridium gasigenes]MBU3132313.1 HAMP domain-containing histidine kinase [Clostridium gasigenes]